MQTIVSVSHERVEPMLEKITTMLVESDLTVEEIILVNLLMQKHFQEWLDQEEIEIDNLSVATTG